MHARKVTSVAVLSVLVVAMTSFAHAGAYSNVFVYGDSLSDTGNIYTVSMHTIPQSPPYYNGRFSNGPLAVEYLANSIHSPLTSFAWGGATTGIGDSGDGGTQTTLGTLGLPGMILQTQASHRLRYLSCGAARMTSLPVERLPLEWPTNWRS